MAQPLRFSRYEVSAHPDGSPHVLAAGAEASVYLAREKESGMPAVLRVPESAQQKNPAARHRFIEEAREMAKVKHPHVAAVLHCGDTTAGAFCAMEFCDGLTLQKAIAQVGTLPWPEAFRLALQLAGALEELDRHGLVHRGLRPTNLIVTTGADGHAHLKLTEYGRMAEDVIRDTVAATKSGFIQTPAYASPEEFLNIVPPDVRSLQYALGAVLWFCLTGRPMFEGTQFEVMFHHVNTEPAWSKLPSLPDAVLAVMKRLLAKSASDRFTPTSALTAALRQASSGVAAAKPDVLDLESAALSGHEMLAQSGGDAFGKIWQARETQSGRIVSLRLLAPQLTAHPSSLATMRKLADRAAALEHARWQRVLRFEPCGHGFRLITEWIHGPTTLAWQKARQTLRLAEVQLFVAQIADAMDFASANGIAAVETAPERLHIQIEGWDGLPEAQRAALLRAPLAGWPVWSAKVCPLRLGADAQAGAEPDVAEAAARQNADFVRLCHRLLTGQGKGTGGHVPTASLTPEGNAFFEQHLGTDALRGFSCRQLLDLLCRAEGIQPVQESGGDPMATRVVRARPAASGENEATPDKAWLAREREALERARREMSAKEAERAKRIAEEQAHVEKMRRALEEQKVLLEEKRREQQRLEQEIQLRAQLEFQKLQEEAKSRDAQLQHKRVAAEEALRQREAEFRAREQQRFAKLETLKRENDAMEDRVQEEYQTLRHVEMRHAQHRQSSPATGSIVLARLAPLEVPGTQRTHEGDTRQADAERRRKRLAAILMGVLAAGVLALFGAAALTLMSGSDVTSPQVGQDFEATQTVPNVEDSDAKPPLVTRPGDALRALLRQAERNPGVAAQTRDHAATLVAQLAALPQDEIESSAPELRAAAETWKLPEAWLALAGIAKDERTRLEHYEQAVSLGSRQARGLAGKLLLERGIRDQHAGVIQQAVAKLYEAADAGDTDAMLVLGDALHSGRSLPADPVEGRTLIQRAASLGHGPSREWLRLHPK